MMGHDSLKRFLKNVAIVFFALAIIVGLFRFTNAGSLTPSASPGGTMNALSTVYSSLIGTAFDSSAITASKNGDALQVAKCIIGKINGSPCP